MAKVPDALRPRKTAADYEREGRDYAHASRKGQTFSGIPAKYEGDSWQARAFRHGYDDEYRIIRASEHHAFVKGIVTKNWPHGAKALSSHIECLVNTACSIKKTNPERAARLHDKAVKLTAKRDQLIEACA